MTITINLNMNSSNAEYERQLSELRRKLTDLGTRQMVREIADDHDWIDEEAEIERIERVGIYKGGMI